MLEVRADQRKRRMLPRGHNCMGAARAPFACTVIPCVIEGQLMLTRLGLHTCHCSNTPSRVDEKPRCGALRRACKSLPPAACERSPRYLSSLSCWTTSSCASGSPITSARVLLALSRWYVAASSPAAKDASTCARTARAVSDTRCVDPG